MQTKSGLCEPCPNLSWQSANRFVPNANRHISAFQKRFAKPFRNIHHLIMLITPLTLLIRIFGVAILGRVQVRPGSHGSARFDGGCPPMCSEMHYARPTAGVEPTPLSGPPGVRQGASGAGSVARAWQWPCGPTPLWKSDTPDGQIG